MNYIIACTSNSKTYLMLQEDEKGSYAVSGFESKEAVMNAFKGYTSAWTRSYESSMSACIGMMSMQPVALKAPDNVNDLDQYIISMKPFRISGGAIGRGYVGLEVDKKILELKEFEVWGETMIEAGIKDPNS